ncbi:MAG: 23S rRNA (pseudouridine(1915)-N(3))-methyltransferase RlmH [Limnochordaceae bacterium]|nr:23S rRNA (pseudouridine(1915)-N(3))-methyltransferase RlmH [Limnochordaceae bacterium]
MPDIWLTTVGPLRGFYKEGVEEYARRLSASARFHLQAVRPEPLPAHVTPSGSERIQAREAERLRLHQPQQAWLIALTPGGPAYDTLEFARHLKDWWEQSGQRLAFVIGGTLGLHPSLVAVSTQQLSLSRLTFAHELAALVLMEQLYRAFRIIRGEPYHY